MEFKFYNLYNLYSDMRHNHRDIDSFNFEFNEVTFDVVVDIGTVPFELMIGARKHNWACILFVKNSFVTEMKSSDFWSLCDILSLKPGKETFTSFDFLRRVDAHFPKTCSSSLTRPSLIQRFRDTGSSKGDGDVFWGWNDHIKDGRTARNFDKTERFFGKHIADYCRRNNVSSIWHNSKDGDTEKPPVAPPGY